MSRKRKGRLVSGWLVLDKPLSMGSTSAVGKVRWLYDAAKAGHAGTLDPLATGLLPIALGEATKTVSYISDGEKSYNFVVRWGIETTTDDTEGESVHTGSSRPSTDSIHSILPEYTGEISQIPPSFSAVRINGKRAYVESRAGRSVSLSSRLVHISSLRLTSHDGDTTAFEVECGKGTYIRSLARDMGRQLGCYGHILSIRRTFVEPFEEKDAITLDKLLEHEGDFSSLDSFLISPFRSMYSYEHLSVDTDQARRIRLGNSILVRRTDNIDGIHNICAVHKDSLVAIGDIKDGEFCPRKVLANH